MTDPAFPEPAEPRTEKTGRDLPDESTPDIAQPVCDLCGTKMFEWHCRLVCPSCGYQRDCSDP